MSSPLPVTRAGRTAVFCGAAGYVSTWLVHLKMAQIWRELTPYEVWDGTIIALTGGLLAALVGLFLSRIVKRLGWMVFLCVLMLLAVPVMIAISGFSGFITADILLRLVGRYNDNVLVTLGYYVMPPIWATIIGLGLCWYYKATHGGVSLLNFQPPARYHAEPSDEMPPFVHEGRREDLTTEKWMAET